VSLADAAILLLRSPGAAPPRLPATTTLSGDAPSFTPCIPRGSTVSGLPLSLGRPNTTPACGFVPHGPSSSHLGGFLKARILAWADQLRFYPDSTFACMLLSIFDNGASLGTDGASKRVHIPPYRLNRRELNFVREETHRRLLTDEVRVVPSNYPSFITPLAAVPKGRDQLRAIHDLRALNDLVPPSFATLRYATLDTLFDDLSQLPAGASLWKADLANAFRNILLSPLASKLAGFELDGVTYVDLCMPFGSRVAPVIFNYVAEALHWILSRKGVRQFIHYLAAARRRLAKPRTASGCFARRALLWASPSTRRSAWAHQPAWRFWGLKWTRGLCRLVLVQTEFDG